LDEFDEGDASESLLDKSIYIMKRGLVVTGATLTELAELTLSKTSSLYDWVRGKIVVDRSGYSAVGSFPDDDGEDDYNELVFDRDDALDASRSASSSSSSLSSFHYPPTSSTGNQDKEGFVSLRMG
jgi:hypothetical protein